jgi:TolC family type I secretion outer membrane protein
MNAGEVLGFNCKRDAHMSLVQPRRIRWRRGTRLLVAATVVGAAAHLAAAADPHSDFFEPDVLRTGSALAQRTPGLTDPLGRACAEPGGALSLAAAIDQALCRNPATRSAWAAAHQQAAALGSAEGAWLPDVSATGAESRAFGEHTDVTGTVTSAAQNTRDAAVNLSWVLYDFGARDGRITSARHLLDAAAANASSVSQQTVLNVVQSYFGVVAADASLIAAKTNESADGRSFEVARSLREGGAGTRADVLQAETAFDQAVLARVQAEAAAKNAHGTLAVTLGLLADQTLTLAPEPVPAEAPALTARMADLMAEAMRQRPDLAAALAQRDSAAANVTVARAAGWPSIAVSAGRDLVDTTGIPHQNYSLIGVNVTVPIFTGFNVDYGVRQAKAALSASEANADQVRLGVSLGVWNAYYLVNSANQQLTVTSGLIRTAEENQQVALGRYQAGVGTIVDVLTAQAAAALARQTRINAELGWQVARAQLALALGRLTGAEPLSTIEVAP